MAIINVVNFSDFYFDVSTCMGVIIFYNGGFRGESNKSAHEHKCNC